MTNSKLKATIGKRLYDRLTPAQRMLMVKTAGAIEFQPPIEAKIEGIWDFIRANLELIEDDEVIDDVMKAIRRYGDLRVEGGKR